MQKVAILTDSIACLTPEMVRQYRLRIIPSNIHFDGREYRDGVDITNQEAYRLLEMSPEHFVSSPASVGEYMAAYQEVLGYAESILCVTLSSRLSTLYNMANIAREEASLEFPRCPVIVLDSETAAIGEGLIVTASTGAGVLAVAFYAGN